MARVAWLFFPFSWLYGLILRIRHFLYDQEIFSIHRPANPSIIIGNLSFGGTGKTPMTAYLTQKLGPENVCILSRGYGRKSKGFFAVDPEGLSSQFGDEPLELAQQTGAPVFVCEKRKEACEQLELSHPNSIFLLDDALQHRAIQGQTNILLTTYNRPFFTDQLAPVGYLRDLKSRSKSASLVVVTKCPPGIRDSEKKEIRNRISKYTSAPVFFTFIFNYFEPVLASFPKTPPSEAKHLLFTGIADNSLVQKHLEKEGLRFETVSFRDHAKIGPEEIQKILTNFTKFASPDGGLITTRKDWVRLNSTQKQQLTDYCPVYLLGMEQRFVSLEEEGEFLKHITDAIAHDGSTI